MNWILYFVIAVLCALSGLGGLIAGINLNPQSTVKFVPILGSVGDWVAGLGALLAVVVALAQSAKQQERERAKAKISIEHGDNYWSLRVRSEGLVPVIVDSVCLEHDDYRCVIDLQKRPLSNLPLPKKLERGEVLSVIDLKGAAFRSFGQDMARHIVRELESRGVTSGSLEKGFNENFFEELNAAGLRKARLLLRAAHEDIRYELPQRLIVNLFTEAALAERQRREIENTSLRNAIAELVEGSKALNIPTAE